MKKLKQSYLLFFFIVVFVLILCSSIENYENIYESNQVLPDQPDDKQFYACRQEKFTDDEDYPFQQYPNSNYRVLTNQVSKPLKGPYSAFLDVNKIRTYDHFYHSPICEDDITHLDYDTMTINELQNILSEFNLSTEDSKEQLIQRIRDNIIEENHSFTFNTDINSQFRLIPGAFPDSEEESLRRSSLYEQELEKDSHDLRNPYFFYGNPKFIQNKITYDDEINTMFLNVKQGLDAHHEDASHYEGIEPRYNIPGYNRP